MKKSTLALILVLAMLLTCSLTAFAAEGNPTGGDEITGNLTVTTFFNEKTNAVPLKSGESYTFKFNNKSNGTNNWENFILAVTGATGADYTGAEQEVLIIRADNWGWGGGMSDFVDPNAAEGNKLAFETNIDFDNWLALTNAGVDVEVTIARDGNTLTYNATIGDYYVNLTATSGIDLPETTYVFLTGENCVLTGITATKTGPETTEPEPTEPEPTEPEATEPEATEPEATEPEATEPEATEPEVEAPKIEGSLTVTSFFNEKTNAVPLKSGESYTFKFNNKSNGTNNWENFILAVTGATGADYTGAEQEVLIIRADNWGWGGGMSDFAAPDGTGNILQFESNINWDEWVAMMQAGVDVTVTISRNGNTLTYNAAIGDYYVKLTATSGKALPETTYVFLTGENCVLSNIQTVSTPHDNVPQTGDSRMLGLWISLMVLSVVGIAIIVAKVYPVLARKK